MECPLCLGSNNSAYDQDKLRSYFLCHDCSLIFVPRESLLSPADEAKRYAAHQNNENDPYYRDYLSQIVEATKTLIPKKARGLDFGCGKTTLLSQIYREYEFEVDSYDVYFHPDQNIWKLSYDFIVLSEVIEHLADPRQIMERITKLLKPDGQLFIKTKFYPVGVKAFSDWFYKRDQTHVQFFDPHSMSFLTKHLGFKKLEKLQCEDLVRIFY